MKKIFKHIGILIDFMRKANRSHYPFREKLEVFRFLLSSHCKGILFKNKEIVTQKMFDFKVSAYDYDLLKYLFEEIFLSNEYYFDAKKKSPQIMDCGANIGMSVLYFKKLYPDCAIIAFEPNPLTFKLLEANVEQNKLKNVQLVNVGLSNSEGNIDFYTNTTKGTLVGSFFEERGGANKIVVKSERLSKFIDKANFDIIKMDIEGAETAVIENIIAEGKLDHCPKYIIEYHHRINGLKSEFAKFVQAFEDHQFDYNLRSDFNELGSFQDILLCFYKDEKVNNTVANKEELAKREETHIFHQVEV